MKKLLTVLIVLFFCNAIYAQLPDNKPGSRCRTEIRHTKSAVITCKIVDAGEYRFGFDIFIDKLLAIRQLNIPCLKEGFNSREDAQRVAELVIAKIKRGEAVVVTYVELERMGIQLQ